MSTDGDGIILEQEQEKRRWEEMNEDCLANAFSRTGMKSLLLAIPFVCKSWYKASLSPECWTCLFFPDYVPTPLLVSTVEEIEMGPQSFGTFYEKFIDEYGIDKSRFSITGFVKLVVGRSKGKATELELPMYGTKAALRYVANVCPLLRHLSFQDDLVIFKHSRILPQVIGKWKFLESLSLRPRLVVNDEQKRDGNCWTRYFQELLAPDILSRNNVLERIIAQIGTHCKHFRQLNLIQTHLHQDGALAIANFLPHLQIIVAVGCIIQRDSISTIVRGCKELRVFYAKESTGFDEDGRQTGKVVLEDCVPLDRRLFMRDLSSATLMRNFVYYRLRMSGQ
uniref:F-box/LRR-repeat protein At3g48880-like n=1 Tax=Fragaria vesca subsp. vesca TaxID=101020 RepID=UPI0005CB7913|nr:PREDICTED: F-box/LRR-repeat protein At3g48880-like [Fragaria vesca subsp. vesca]